MTIQCPYCGTHIEHGFTVCPGCRATFEYGAPSSIGIVALFVGGTIGASYLFRNRVKANR